MNHLLTTNQPHIYAVLAGLFVFGVVYAAIVRYVRSKRPDHGYTAFWVVGGDLAIVIGFGLIAGLEAAALLFFCMAAAGLPMIVEYINHWLTAGSADRLEL